MPDWKSRLELLPWLLAMLVVTSCVHEAGHAWVAWRLGDRREDIRLRKNPFTHRHISWIFTLALPGLLFLFGGPMLGGARPVFVRLAIGPRRMGLVALAGPVGNFLVGFTSIAVLGLLLHLGVIHPIFGPFGQDKFYFGALYAITLSFVLGFLNLIPLPPFDGSRIVAVLLPERIRVLYYKLTIPVLILFVVFAFGAFKGAEEKVGTYTFKVLLWLHDQVLHFRDWIER